MAVKYVNIAVIYYLTKVEAPMGLYDRIAHQIVTQRLLEFIPTLAHLLKSLRKMSITFRFVTSCFLYLTANHNLHIQGESYENNKYCINESIEDEVHTYLIKTVASKATSAVD